MTTALAIPITQQLRAAQQVSIMVHLKAEHGKARKLKQKLLHLQQCSVQENGCLSYEVYQSSDDRDGFHIYECYVDDDAINFHFNQPYVIDFTAELDSLLEEPFTIWKSYKISN